METILAFCVVLTTIWNLCVWFYVNPYEKQGKTCYRNFLLEIYAYEDVFMFVELLTVFLTLC